MRQPWDAEWDITVDLVRGLLHEQFPELWPLDLRHFAAGWDNEVFLINDSIVFRFPRRTIGGTLLEVEHRALPFISTFLSIPISVPHYIGQPSPRYPFSFSGYPMIPGRPVHFMNLSVEKRMSTASIFASFLRSLHDIPKSSLEPFNLPDDTIGRLDFDVRVPKFHALVNDASTQRGLLDNEIQAKLLSLTESLPSTAALPTVRVVCHGDLNFRNFLVQEDGELSGVIDWGDLHLGHPAVDLSVVYAYFPPSARDAFWSVYGDVNEMTKRIARFRAANMLLNVIVSAHDQSNEAQLREAQLELSFALT